MTVVAPLTRGMHIRSADRVIDILEFLATVEGGWVNLGQLSVALDTAPSTLHHLLATLKARRFVTQHPQTRMYGPGERLIELGQLALHSVDLSSLAQPTVLALSAAAGQDSSFVIFRGFHRSRLVTARVKGLAVRPASRLSEGAVQPVAEHATAAGKVLLAYLPEEALQQFLRSVALHRYTERTITSADTLLAELAAVRRRELASDDGETDPLIGCLATPVRDASQRVIGCLDVIYPLRDRPDPALLADRIQQHAASLSAHLQALGYRVE